MPRGIYKRKLGRKLSQETKEKIRETCKRNGVGKWMIGRVNFGFPAIIKNCLICKKEFKIWVSSVKRGQGKFCSKKCCGKYQTQIGVEIRKCLICDNSFKVSGSQKTEGYGHFCSSYCYGLSKRGSSYKDDEATKVRRSPEYRKWRKQVFVRDDYTCQNCEKRGVRLHADHIKPFCDFPELRLDINNGRTLCKLCHYKTPTWGGRRRMSLSLTI